MRIKFIGRCSQAIAIAVCLSLVGMMPAAAQQKGGKVVFASVKLPSLNPLHAASAIGIVSAQIYGTLVRLDEDWTVQPNIADSWDVSEDGLTYTFHLNAKALFHDSQPLTSEDVKWSLENTIKNHRFGPAMFGAVATIDTPDAQTVVLGLSQPSPAMLRSMSSPRFLPICRYVRTLGTLPVNYPILGGGSFYDERRT